MDVSAMTSQQRADEWLAVWRGLRAIGYTPEQRDRVIRNAIFDYHVEQIQRSIHDVHAQSLS